MKIVLLMKDNSYCGREYLSALMLAKIKVDVIYYGKFPKFNKSEDDRCGGLWRPMCFEKLKCYFNCYHFESLNDDRLFSLLNKNKYDFGIQGGTDLLNSKIIKVFSVGILNLHPGNLPQYRGCSAPEWQIYDGQPIVSTCHIIDEGIDTGPIYFKKKLDIDIANYYNMRSQIYPKQSKFLIEILNGIGTINEFKKRLTFQDERYAYYRNYIGDDIIKKMKKNIIL